MGPPVSADKTRYGCGRNVTITLPDIGSTGVRCGFEHHGEIIQCEECQENNPAPELEEPWHKPDCSAVLTDGVESCNCGFEVQP